MSIRGKTHLCSARRRRLTRKFANAGIDALLVASSANVRYLSGFTGEDSYLMVGRGWTALITDSRFAEQARRDCPDIEHVIRKGAMAKAVAGSLRGRGARRLGLESEHATLAMDAALGEVISPRRLRRTSRLVDGLRETKDDAEIRAIRRAVRAAQEAFVDLLAPGARALIGRSEADVAGELEYRMRQQGASGAGFPSIVAAGAHAALPHYRPGSARIRPSQAVLFDWGAVVDGYCSDLTRVVFTGRIPPQLGRIYEVVLQAQQAGIRAVRAGRSVRAVDAAARDVIAAAGFAQRFGHGLGHGVGLEVHERPAVSPRADSRLRKGHVIAVEPGIYIPGVGGIRIEDDVLVTRDGAKPLSDLPKALAAMVLS